MRGYIAVSGFSQLVLDMNPLSVRDATARDAAAIANIWNPIIRETVVTFNPIERSAAEVAEMIATRQATGHAFLVIDLEGCVVGFASYSQFRAGLGYARCMEHTINLGPQAQGRGAGRILLRALEVHAAAAGHHVMVAAITGENAASIRFHAAMGYREVGRMPQVGWKFGKYHDLVLMQKFLSAA